jgi:uncharacterized protein (UPF0128 family)
LFLPEKSPLLAHILKSYIKHHLKNKIQEEEEKKEIIEPKPATKI